MNDIQTASFENWGYRELNEGSILLKLYAENGADFLEEGITLNFNPNSGCVFLSDSDFNVAVEEDGKLAKFYSCPNCGNEGTQSQGLDENWDFEKYEGYCSSECQKA